MEVSMQLIPRVENLPAALGPKKLMEAEDISTRRVTRQVSAGDSVQLKM